MELESQDLSFVEEIAQMSIENVYVCFVSSFEVKDEEKTVCSIKCNHDLLIFDRNTKLFWGKIQRKSTQLRKLLMTFFNSKLKYEQHVLDAIIK